MANNDFAKGFSPLWQPHAKVLVLGTLPSVKSLEQQQYYGHPQNAFWPIMASLFQFDSGRDYVARCAALTKAGIAVWDVLAAAERPGSLDADIKRESIQANPLNALVTQLPQLKLIAFNGQAAAKLFKQHVSFRADSALASLPKKVMPSTSPAYAAMTRDEKRERWSTLLEYL